MVRSGSIEVAPGVALHYEESGTGRPIVFIHGVWASSRFFARQLDHFGRRFHAVALDLRGHGRSAMTLKEQTVATYARDLKSFLERLGLVRPILVGWSMGAFVIWDFVRQFGPGDIAAVVVVDQAPSDLRSAAEPEGMIGIEFLAVLHRRTLDDRAALVHELIPMIFAHPPAAADHRWLHAEMCRAPEVIAAAILVDQTFQDYRDVLDGFPIPTLVCYGERGTQPKASLRWIAAAARQGDAVEFKGCGHSLFIEDPAAFNATVEAFIAKVIPSP
ncbi:MAG: alpha/beta hydrolase [Alphaproteobacteria bacterium]|nr:alpha/beta hydrolase [Alphaproteobacteria bacterium]